MVAWIPPAYTRSRVRKAGKNIKSGAPTAEDILVLENWRASHYYVMNTFKVMLYRRARKHGFRVAQRLKRRSTIMDKLIREPTMQLPNMHDIAGFRLIFENETSLQEVRQSLLGSKMNHKKISADGRYDYIANPKNSGYRGVHDVFEYVGSSPYADRWRGHLIEIQYRTTVQHSWATAVEVADFISGTRVKFSDAQSELTDFFKITSEVLARVYEGQKSCLDGTTDAELYAKFDLIEKKTGILNALRRLQMSENKTEFKDHTLLIFDSSKPDPTMLRLETFDSFSKAIERYEVLERSKTEAQDIVLVRADSPETVRIAFKNYFSDAQEFVDLVSDGVDQLTEAEIGT